MFFIIPPPIVLRKNIKIRHRVKPSCENIGKTFIDKVKAQKNFQTRNRDITEYKENEQKKILSFPVQIKNKYFNQNVRKYRTWKLGQSNKNLNEKDLH